jgi:hypothetical protein
LRSGRKRKGRRRRGSTAPVDIIETKVVPGSAIVTGNALQRVWRTAIPRADGGEIPRQMKNAQDAPKTLIESPDTTVNAPYQDVETVRGIGIARGRDGDMTQETAMVTGLQAEKHPTVSAVAIAPTMRRDDIQERNTLLGANTTLRIEIDDEKTAGAPTTAVDKHMAIAQLLPPLGSVTETKHSANYSLMIKMRSRFLPRDAKISKQMSSVRLARHRSGSDRHYDRPIRSHLTCWHPFASTNSFTGFNELKQYPSPISDRMLLSWSY